MENNMRYLTNNTDIPYWTLAPINQYDLSNDSRYLIPFMTKFHKMGMMDHEGVIIVEPQYDIICNDIYCETDLFIVGNLHPYSFIKKNEELDSRVKYLYGVMNTNGELVLDVIYKRVLLGINSNRITAEKDYRDFYVFNNNGQEIESKNLHSYAWIDGFDNGLARVKNAEEQWGLINEEGEEVLPLEYAEIWNFYNKNRNTTKVYKNGVMEEIVLSDYWHIKNNH